MNNDDAIKGTDFITQGDTVRIGLLFGKTVTGVITAPVDLDHVEIDGEVYPLASIFTMIRVTA